MKEGRKEGKGRKVKDRVQRFKVANILGKTIQLNGRKGREEGKKEGKEGTGRKERNGKEGRNGREVGRY